MLKRNLNLYMEHFSCCGHFLNVEEQLLLQVSLPLLQKENKLTFVSFLGKIFGMNDDYYIVQGRGADFIRNKKTFYSMDGVSWRLLLPPSEEDISFFHLVRTRFTGNPVAKHHYRRPNDTGETKAAMTEERRLSALVKLMDFETAIGPKNALVINSKGIINRNPYFKGITKIESTDLSSYLHFRLPDEYESFVPTSVVCPPGGDRSRQFLEPITLDYPEGCWTIQSHPLKEIVYLRSLWWPGHTFYHIPETGEYNSIYVGYGERNDDLPVMI